jgi:hypothetical protein
MSETKIEFAFEDAYIACTSGSWLSEQKAQMNRAFGLVTVLIV